MMTQKKSNNTCIPIAEAASELKIDVPELLQLACSGGIVAGIRDFTAAHKEALPIGLLPPLDFSGDPLACRYVGVLSLAKRDLEKLASEGEVYAEVGYLHRLWVDQGVIFDQPRKITIADIVVPREAIQKPGSATADSGSASTVVSSHPDATLLRTIGALTLILARRKGTSSNLLNAPSKNALANEVQNTLDALTKEHKLILDRNGLKLSNLRDIIAEGLHLLKQG